MSNLEKRIQSEARAAMRVTNDALVCRDCVYRWDDSTIYGNTSQCQQYPNYSKPNYVLVGYGCFKYKKEVL